MSLLDKYLALGWKVKPIGPNAKNPKKQIKCPNCPLTLTVSSKAPACARQELCDEVSSMADLSNVLASRRFDLGLTADDIDHVAGLTHRHTQKVEDAGRRMAETRTPSTDALLGLMVEAERDPGARDVLDMMVARGLGRLADGKTRRIPTFDTVLLVIAALGGRIKIEWGEPPRIAQRLMKLSQKDRQIGFWD